MAQHELADGFEKSFVDLVEKEACSESSAASVERYQMLLELAVARLDASKATRTSKYKEFLTAKGYALPVDVVISIEFGEDKKPTKLTWIAG